VSTLSSSLSGEATDARAGFAEQFTPWQLIVSTLTGVYAARNLDKIVGLSGKHVHVNSYELTLIVAATTAPDPLANLVCMLSPTSIPLLTPFIVLTIILSCHMDCHWSRRRVRDRHDGPPEVAQRYLLCAFLDILHHICYRGSGEGMFSYN
jgi:hypothetical protein